MNSPIVFISYSWDNEPHKNWVLNLAEHLIKDGVEIILDRYYLSPGKNLHYFVENSINRSNRIIVVLTPTYKTKAEKRIGGVGHEYSLLNIELLNNILENDKIIPILKDGCAKDSIPSFMHQYIYIDFTKESKFQENYDNLLRDLYKEPKIKKPQPGGKPRFEETNQTKTIIPNNYKKNVEDKVLQIRYYISKGDISLSVKIVESINNILGLNNSDDIILLKAQLNDFEHEQRIGILTNEEIKKKRYIISQSILGFINNLIML